MFSISFSIGVGRGVIVGVLSRQTALIKSHFMCDGLRSEFATAAELAEWEESIQIEGYYI